MSEYWRKTTIENSSKSNKLDHDHAYNNWNVSSDTSKTVHVMHSGGLDMSTLINITYLRVHGQLKQDLRIGCPSWCQINSDRHYSQCRRLINSNQTDDGGSLSQLSQTDQVPAHPGCTGTNSHKTRYISTWLLAMHDDWLADWLDMKLPASALKSFSSIRNPLTATRRDSICLQRANNTRLIQRQRSLQTLKLYSHLQSLSHISSA